jgi:hypothetical protein
MFPLRVATHRWSLPLMYHILCRCLCRRLSRPRSTMNQSEFPVPCSVSTFRLTAPTCIAGGQGVLPSSCTVLFQQATLSDPGGIYEGSPNRPFHFGFHYVNNVAFHFYLLTGLYRLRKCGTTLWPTGFAVYASP